MKPLCNRTGPLQTEAAHGTVQLLAPRKFRRKLSCFNCRERKVRCDRVKPCRACCIRGTPATCEYGTLKDARNFIEQSDLIHQLRLEVKTLKQRLAECHAIQGTPAPAVSKTPELANQKSELLSMPSLRGASATLSVSKKLLVEAFVGELINAFAPEGSNSHGRIFDLRSALEKRRFSPLLAAGFDATALIFIGQRDQNQHIVTAGKLCYNQALRTLQESLSNTKQCKSTEVLTMVVLVTIIEAMNQSSPGTIMKHQLGGLQLLRLRTPYRHQIGFESSLFVDLRMFWLATAIASRKATFLASEPWMTVPWLENDLQKDIFHLLLDIAVEIPAFLGQYDAFRLALCQGRLLPNELVSTRNHIQTVAITLDRRLQLWHSVYATNYEIGDLTEPSPERFPYNTDVPRFYCRDIDTGETYRPSELMYPDLLLTTTMCLYRALRLVVARGDNDDLCATLGPSERYQLAVDICRSMPYFLQIVPGLLVIESMFILRVAFDTFSDGTTEKEFVKEIFAYVGRKYRLRVFINQCSEFSAVLQTDVPSIY